MSRAVDGPLVSVVVTTYAQERFVGEALASVLAQRAEFEMEVLVGVDASPDATAEVVRRFESETTRLRAIRQPRRVGLHENFRATFAEARGRYVALLEGDDFWTDAGKLEKQVRLLEGAPGAVLCGHLVEQIALDGTRLGTIPEALYPAAPDRGEFVDRLCDLHTSSLVFRNVFAGGVPEVVIDRRSPVIDLPLKLALVAEGELRFVPEAMSVFRRVPGSASSSITDEGWRDVITRALRRARPRMPAALRRVLDRRLVALLVDGANNRLCPRRRRLGLALEALGRSPTRAIPGLVRGVYAGLPEPVQRLYRGARARALGSAGGEPG